jgi:hypothetical protein
MGQGRSMDFLRDHILNNLKMKILAVILAITLWFAISYMGESKMSVSVKVAPLHLSRDYIVKKIDTDDILVTVSGPVSLLKNIRARDIKATIDLSNAKEGPQTVNLEQGNIQVPQGIKVAHIDPDYLMIDIDRAVEKRLKVVVKLHEKWTGTYRVKSWYPLYVDVDGSRGSLEKRSTIETLPVDNDFRNDEEERYTGLDTKDMVLTRVKPDTIRVIVRRY